MVLPKKPVLILTASLLLVGLGFLVWFFLENNRSNKTTQASKTLCVSDDLGTTYQTQYHSNSAPNMDDYKAFIETIKATPGHDYSVNCLYIITKYNQSVTDVNEARKYYGMLISLADSSQTWVDELIVSETREELAARFEAYSQFEEQYRRNIKRDYEQEAPQ